MLTDPVFLYWWPIFVPWLTGSPSAVNSKSYLAFSPAYSMKCYSRWRHFAVCHFVFTRTLLTLDPVWRAFDISNSYRLLTAHVRHRCVLSCKQQLWSSYAVCQWLVEIWFSAIWPCTTCGSSRSRYRNGTWQLAASIFDIFDTVLYWPNGVFGTDILLSYE